MQKPLDDPLFFMDIDAARTFEGARIDGDNIVIERPDRAYKRLAVFMVPFENGLAPVPFVSKDEKHWVVCCGAERNGTPIDLPHLMELCQEGKI